MSHKSTRNRLSSISRLPAKSYHRRLRAMRRKLEQEQITTITNRLIHGSPAEYIPCEGMDFITLDYAQMETRIAAFYNSFPASGGVQNPVIYPLFPEMKQYTQKR